MIHHISFRNIRATLADGDDKLCLKVEILRQRRVGHGTGRIERGISGFGEKERRVAHVVAHFKHMRLIVAAHAKDAAHRETVAGALNGKAALLWGVNHIHHWVPLGMMRPRNTRAL